MVLALGSPGLVLVLDRKEDQGLVLDRKEDLGHNRHKVKKTRLQ
jgi:hypothetical protein